MEKSRYNTKKLAIGALFIALSFVGSYLKLFGTIAFDSLPGFLAALLFGPLFGAAIGFIGHIFTALTSGFPLSIPIHIVIAATMAITMFGFGSTYKILQKKISETNVLIVTGAVGVLLNGPVSLAFTIGVMALIAGIEAAFGLLSLLPVLVAAAAANVLLSIILFKSLAKVWGKIK
jgi:uncharacterized membrane protein